jgi:hypothetical protein
VFDFLGQLCVSFGTSSSLSAQEVGKKSGEAPLLNVFPASPTPVRRVNLWPYLYMFVLQVAADGGVVQESEIERASGG